MKRTLMAVILAAVFLAPNVGRHGVRVGAVDARTRCSTPRWSAWRELERKEERVIPWLFPHLDGAHVGGRITDPRKAWESACEAAGRPGLLIHDLRRSAVRNMEAAGVPRSVAMRRTGHKTENVYRPYAIVSDADLEAAAVKLARISGLLWLPEILSSNCLIYGGLDGT